MLAILTNDDGIEAPGLRSLHQAIRQVDAVMADQAVIVAPLHPHSGCGHQVTTHRPLRLDCRSQTEFALEGTPADCTRVGLSHLHPEAQWVLSGINAGGNLGSDIYISGTVAAVREAALHRVAGIALSHYIHKGRVIDWALASRLTARVLKQLFALPIQPGTFWNVNLPHLEAGAPDPDLVFCPLCTQPLPSDYRRDGEWLHYTGQYGRRSRDSGADVDVCFSGHIAITQIGL